MQNSSYTILSNIHRRFSATNRASSHFHSRRKGSVIVLVALSMIVVLGAGAISVDYGLMVADKNRLQRACDAAALAGVSQLKVTGNDSTDTTTARNLAVQVGAQNGVTLNPNDITFANDNKLIRVPAQVTRNFFFGRAIGITSKQVGARAAASLFAGDDLTTSDPKNRVVPIGITWETYNSYKNTTSARDLVLIRQNKEVFGLDDYVLFDLRDTNAKSPAFMQRQITGEDSQTVSIGDFETTLNAAKAAEIKKVTDGVETLFDYADEPPFNDEGNTSNSSSGSTYYQNILNGSASRTNPRVVHLIVTPSTTEASNGTYDTEVQAFAPVYLETIFLQEVPGENKNEADLILRVRFLPAALAGEGEAQPNPDAPLGGIRVASLVE